MGFEGAVVALAVLFLLVYVVPQISKKRSVLADAPVDERYSKNLRLITGQTLHHSGGEHGTIFFTERKMVTNKPMSADGASGKNAAQLPGSPAQITGSANVDNPTQPGRPAQLRKSARERSHARARIAQRAAYYQRGLVAAIGAVALSVLLWIGAGIGPVPGWGAILTTALAGAYLVGFGWLVNTWNGLNEADQGVIAKVDAELTKQRPFRSALQRQMSAARSESATARKSAAVRKPDARNVLVEKELSQNALGKKVATQKVGESERAAKAGKVENSEVVVRKVGSSAEAVAVRRPAGKLAATEAQVNLPARQGVNAPEYTLKPTITKRSVKPYEAPQEPQADVPFRPTKLNQRLGDGDLGEPNAAPEMTGSEELRKDVLGGGATLDTLLDRRRA